MTRIKGILLSNAPDPGAPSDSQAAFNCNNQSQSCCPLKQRGTGFSGWLPADVPDGQQRGDQAQSGTHFIRHLRLASQVQNQSKQSPTTTILRSFSELIRYPAVCSISSSTSSPVSRRRESVPHGHPGSATTPSAPTATRHTSYSWPDCNRTTQSAIHWRSHSTIRSRWSIPSMH